MNFSQGTSARVVLADGRSALREGGLPRCLAVAQLARADRQQAVTSMIFAIAAWSMPVHGRAVRRLVASLGFDDRVDAPTRIASVQSNKVN